MASYREISRLTTNMNTIIGTGRPSRNSQGICNTSQHSISYTTSPSEAQSKPDNNQFCRSVLTENGPSQDYSSSGILPSQRQVESLGRMTGLLNHWPGTIIVCNNILFVVSNNGKIYNFTGGSMKQLYVADPREHKFLVTSANSPSTFSSIISSVLGLFLRFNNRQNSNKYKGEHQKQSVNEASNLETILNTNSNQGMNLSMDTIQEVDVSDLANLSMDIGLDHDAHGTPSVHGDLFQNST